MKFYRDIVEAHPNSKIYDKCWDGYRKVPGKSRGEKGSCEKISNEAYDAWDEFDMWYQFDTTTKKLKQKTWYHAQEREARAAGWHDSHDKAMRAHGYFPSKFKKGEYVIKGADGKWIKVYPYADKGMSEELNELSNTDQESYYRFLMAKVKIGRTLSKQEKEFIKTYQFYKMSVAEGSGGARYKIKSIGRDSKGDYYISPSTGKKVYKSGVKRGDHENPKTGEHKSVAEGFLGDRTFNRVMPIVKRIAGEVSDYDRDEFGEELWSLLDQKYGSKFAQSVLQDDLDFYWNEYADLTGQGVAEGGESGAYYYERLAQRVFDADPNLDASGRAEAVLDAGWTIMVADLGEKTAYSTLNYNEDFASDFVSAYADLQQQGKNKTMTKETQAMTDNSLGYKNTLAVMKAADSSQQATINLGGEPVTLDYPEARFIAGKYKAFLRAGRQEEFFGLMADPAKFDGMMKQLRGLVDKQKNFRGSVPGDRGVPGETQTPWIREGESQYDKSHGSPYDRGGADSWYNRPRRPHKGGVGGDSGERSLDLTPDEIEAYHAGYDDNEKSGGKKQWESVSQGMAEGSDNPVAGAIARRIMSQRLDLLKQYGPELVVAAIDNVADYVGDVEEIGSSDVSAWVSQVERMLKENPPQAFAESLRLVGKHGEGAKTAKVYKDHEWGEFRVKFYTDGKHEGEEADYHTDDKDDANDTAKSWTTKGEKVAESTYWCRQDKTRKLIPEGYKKTAQGYITKL